jgi:predicted transposase
MKQCNSAANFVAEKAFELKIANKFELQKLFYKQIRQEFGLSAQFAIRVISKVVGAYKRDKSKQSRFRMNGAIQYDQRNLSWKKGIDRVSVNYPMAEGEANGLSPFHNQRRHRQLTMGHRRRTEESVYWDSPIGNLDLVRMSIRTGPLQQGFDG